MTYKIIAIDARSSGWIKVCHVESNPEAVAERARRKTYRLKRSGRWVHLPCYSKIEIVEIAEE
jgi:hypothetical protein